jgi:RNA polymerase sigma factor (TIGR02999 family)
MFTAINVTDLLRRWRGGDNTARDMLFETIYPVLRSIAHRELRGSSRIELRATELLHEAYLRICDQRTDWEGRSQFLAIAAQVIRRVVVDAIRRSTADKRGVEQCSVDIGAAERDGELAVEESIDWLLVDQVLSRLAKHDQLAAHVIELRYFGGLTNEEVADHLHIGVATVVRHWQFGRAWLVRRLEIDANRD